MLARITFVLITVFWVTMNILLWRSEYGSHTATGSPIPVEMVFQKILNAPDESPLSIRRHGRRIGTCRVQTSVAEELSKLDEAPRKGMNVRTQIRFDGGFAFEEPPRRARFACELSLSDSRQWEKFHLRLMSRPIMFEVRSVASDQTVQVKARDEEGEFEHTFKFSEFQNPMALLGGLIEPFMEGFLSELDLPVPASDTTPQSPALKWKASNDTLTIEPASVHAYRLQAQLAGRYDVVIFVSRAGEILKAELPDGITLLHEKLNN